MSVLQRLFDFHGKEEPISKEFLDWFDKADQEARHTPDLWRLQQYRRQLMFFPDEFQDNLHKRSLLGDTVGPSYVAFTEAPFTMWKKCLGGETFPIITEGVWPAVPALRIRGELKTIRIPSIIKLDNYRRRGYNFIRKRIPLVLPYQRIHVHGSGEFRIRYERIWAWMYIGNPNYWNSLLKDNYFPKPGITRLKYCKRTRTFRESDETLFAGRFKPVTVYEPNNKRNSLYFHFTPLECLVEPPSLVSAPYVLKKVGTPKETTSSPTTTGTATASQDTAA